jgi:putative two-component system response regulator
VRKRIDVQLKLDEYSNRLEESVAAKTGTIERLSDVTISTIVSLIGTRDEETHGHIRRTGAYVVALAEEQAKSPDYAARLTKERITELRKAAPLHDVGKVGIVDAILKKTDRLTNNEFDDMKLHTVIGGAAFKHASKIMAEPSFLDLATILAWCHHEKWDGSGYPRGIRGGEIPLEARIMAVADVYDALISQRPYKQPLPHVKALEIIMEGSGRHFDPDICAAFSRINKQFEEIANRLGSELDAPEAFDIPKQ